MAKAKLVGILLCMVLLFSAVGAENFAVLAEEHTSSQTDTAEKLNEAKQKASEEQLAYLKTVTRLQSSKEKLLENALVWATEGAKYHYLYNGDTIAYEAVLNTLKGVSAENTEFTQFSKTLRLNATLCTVSFAPWGQPNSFMETRKDKNGRNNLYIVKVLVMSIEWNGTAHCVGIKYPGEYNEKALGREVYYAVSQNPGQAAELKPLPQEKLPTGFTEVSLKKALNTHSISGYDIYQLNDKVLGAVYHEANAAMDKYRTGVVLFDRAGKLIKDVFVADLEPDTYDNCEFVNGKLYLYSYITSKDKKSTIYTRYVVDAAGKVIKETNASKWGFRVYSPDGKQCAYSEKNCIYVVSGKTTRKVIAGQYNNDGALYLPVQWLDNSQLLIEIRHHNTSDLALLDMKTGKPVNVAVGSRLLGVKDGKVYAVKDGYEGDGKVTVYDTKNPKSGSKVVLAPEAWNADAALSPDCKTVVFLSPLAPVTPNNLRVFSLSSGKRMNNVSFYQEGYGSRMFFFENSLAGVVRGSDLIVIDLSKIKDKAAMVDAGKNTKYTPPKQSTANTKPVADNHQIKTDGNVIEGFHHKSITEFNESIVRGEYTTPTEKLSETACRWAETEVNFYRLYAGNFDRPLEGYDYSTTKAKVINEVSFPGRAGDYLLHATLCAVTFGQGGGTSYQASQFGKLEVANYVSAISAEKDGIVRLLGFAFSNGVSKTTTWDTVNEVASCFTDIAAQMKEVPLYSLTDSPLPNGITKISMKKMLGQHYPFRFFAMTKDIFAIEYLDEQGKEGVFKRGAILYNSKGQLLKEIPITGDIVDRSTYGGILVFVTRANSTSPLNTLAIDAAGKATEVTEKNGWQTGLASPDGSKKVFTVGGNLYVYQKGSSRLLLSMGVNTWDSPAPHFPMCWIDNTSVAYYSGTINNHTGGGVVNVVTGEVKSFNIREGLPIAYREGKLSLMEMHGFGDDVVNVNTQDTLYQPLELISQENEDGFWGYDNSFCVSSDSSKIIFGGAATKNGIRTNKLRVYSLLDGKLINEVMLAPYTQYRIFSFDGNTAVMYSYDNNEMISVDLSKLK